MLETVRDRATVIMERALLLTGPCHNFTRHFSKYRWFSEFAEFPEVREIAVSHGHYNAKKLSASGGSALDPTGAPTPDSL